MSTPNLRQILLEPLLKLEADVRAATGTTPAFGVFVHSALFDALVAELADRASGILLPDPANPRIGDWLYFGARCDSFIAPERERQRLLRGAPVKQADPPPIKPEPSSGPFLTFDEAAAIAERTGTWPKNVLPGSAGVDPRDWEGLYDPSYPRWTAGR